MIYNPSSELTADDETVPTENVVAVRKTYTSIEGVMKRLSAESRHGYTATINDRLTAAAVEFPFDHEDLETIKGLFNKNVVAEGELFFTGDIPLQFAKMPTIRERKRGKPLRAFLGVLPALPDGEVAEDAIERLHDASASE